MLVFTDVQTNSNANLYINNPENISFNYFAVAGGGGGNGGYNTYNTVKTNEDTEYTNYTVIGGNGGGGGETTISNLAFSSDFYNIIIGAGGDGAAGGNQEIEVTSGKNGTNTIIKNTYNTINIEVEGGMGGIAAYSSVGANGNGNGGNGSFLTMIDYILSGGFSSVGLPTSDTSNINTFTYNNSNYVIKSGGGGGGGGTQLSNNIIPGSVGGFQAGGSALDNDDITNALYGGNIAGDGFYAGGGGAGGFSGNGENVPQPAGSSGSNGSNGIFILTWGNFSS
jgi:hypothetical protein